MSGGHWNYNHSDVSNSLGGIDEIDHQYIQGIVNEVRSDLMGLMPIGYFNDADETVLSVANKAVDRLEAVQAEIDSLMVHVHKLAGLVSYYTESYKIIDAFDYLYSGDIGMETLKERLEIAMGIDNNE